MFTRTPSAHFKKRPVSPKSSTNTKVNVGDSVEFHRDGEVCKGKVIIVRDNSVIVKMGIDPKTGEPHKTVVNHKNYTICSQSKHS